MSVKQHTTHVKALEAGCSAWNLCREELVKKLCVNFENLARMARYEKTT